LVTRAILPGPAVAVALVAEPVLAALELGELADVGAGDEGLAAGALEHQDPDRVVGIDLLAGVVQPLVHVPGHRVAGLGAVEGQRDDRALALDDDVLAGRAVFMNAKSRANTKRGACPRC
jgi:hypothetical protein